jgi:hypothetical protein
MTRLTDPVIQTAREITDRRVLAALTPVQWFTADELAECCDLRPWQADASLHRLRARGLICHDGFRHWRKNPPIEPPSGAR